MLSAQDINKLIEYLRGTCNTLDEAMETLFNLEVDDLDADDHAAIDDAIFLCEQCNWWCEVSDRGEDEDGDLDNICRDCCE